MIETKVKVKQANEAIYIMVRHRKKLKAMKNRRSVMSVRRIFVEKKPDYAVKAGELREELVSYLGITGVKRYGY